MATCSVLRLLGFLGPQPPSARDVMRARKECCTALGLPDPGSDEEALLAALRPVLAQRGLRDLFDALGGDRVLLCGAVDATAAHAVVVERVDLRGEALDVLARASLTEHGQFAVSFTAPTSGLVCVTITRKDGGAIHRSPPRKPLAEGWFEWSEDGSRIPPPGRFAVREARLAAVLAESGMRFSDLGEGEHVAAGVAGLSGIPEHLVKQHLAAGRLAGRLDLPGEVVSALLGPPPRPEERRVSPDELERESGELQPDKRLAAPTRPGSADDVSRVSGHGPELVATLLADAVAAGELSAAAPKRLAEIRQRLAKHQPRARAEAREPLRAAPELVALAGGEPRAVEPLRKLSARAVARMPADALDAALESSLPRADERRRKIDEMLQAADRSFPGDALLRRRAGGLSDASRRFLERRGDDFDLLHTFVDGELFGPAPRANVPATERTVVREELLRLQRVARVARDASLADVLLSKGYESAQQIAFADPTAFVAELARAGIPEEAAARIRRRALAHYRATLETYLRHNLDASGPAIPALQSGGARPADVAQLSIPTYAYLFGSQDYGVVEDWEGVTSTGAYLVDLLVWLSRARTPGALRPYDVLVARRPDLVSVLLNRENAKVLVPHVDLVCELLEDEVAARAGRRHIPTAELQTRLSEKEIRAYPEHVNGDVYELLRTSTLAMSLPFDLPLLEFRGYLEVPDLPGGKLDHPTLVRLLGPALSEELNGKPSPAALRSAAAEFGLNETDVSVMTTPRPDAAAQARIWGTSTVSNVADFLRRAPAPARPRDHLSYDEAMAVLRTHFVDPNGSIRIRLADGVDVDRCKAEERIFDPPLSAAFLDRIHRLLRLARHAPWTIADLDVLLWASGSELDTSCLVRLAALRRLQDHLKLGAEELASFFRDFGEADAQGSRLDGTPTLYRRVYLVRSDAESVPAVFLRANAPPQPIAAHEDRIRAALGVSGDDLSALLQLTNLGGQSVSFAALSRIARHALLARALSRGGEEFVREHVALVHLLGDPFRSPHALQDHVDAVARIRAAGLTGISAACLCGRRDPALPDLAALDVALDELRASARTALEKSGAPAAPGDVERKLIASGAWAGPVAGWAGGDARAAALALAVDGIAKLSGAILGPAAPARTAALLRLVRIVLLVDELHLTAVEAASVNHLPGFAELLDRPSWVALSALLADLALARDGSSVEAVAAYHRAASGAHDVRTLATSLARALGLEADKLEATWRKLDPADPSQRAHDARVLGRVRDGTRLAQALGVPPAALMDWAALWPDLTRATAVREAVRATLPREAWLERSAAVQDRLRARKRDALIDYILASKRPAQSDEKIPEPASVADLPARFLIDVEMGPERNTSRIVQAASAVQLLVQRCLLGLERKIVPDAATAAAGYWSQWEWRKRYRLWEANRKIFLYPENFLTLNNRADASAPFREFKKKVLQAEISEENVSQALEDYLVGLDDVSRLSYECMDYQTSATTGAAVLGVVGRSAGTPPAYYYRRFHGGVWTPWEEVSLGASASPLALAQADRRAWIVWPTVADQLHPDQELPAAQEGELPSNEPGKGITYVRYSWTFRDDRGIWAPVKTTSRALLMEPRNPRSFVLNVRGDVPSPQAFSTVMFSPDRQQTSDAVFWTSQMEVVRDTTRLSLQPRLSWFDAKAPTNERKWGDHWAEYRYGTLDHVDARLDPWDGMHFDGNQLVADPAESFTLRIPVPGGGSADLLTVKAPLAATKPRKYTPDPSGLKTRPAADVFVVSGGLLNGASGAASWAMMFASPELQEVLLPAQVRARLNIPAGKFLAVPAYHPFSRELLAKVRSGGFRSLYTPALQESPSLATLGREPLELGQALGLSTQKVVVLTGGELRTPGSADRPPRESFDFDALSPYGLYNYETFFFAPLFVAQQLSAAQRFDVAQSYYHFIFNPLSTEAGTSSARFWVTRPFRQVTTPEDVEAILTAAARPPVTETPWRVVEDRPFDPHAVAANRPSAYQKYVVRCYLQNLIDWGDQLYRRNTREDVDQAIPLYQLAQTILGERPNELRLLGRRPDRAFVQPSDWLGGSNVLVQLEALVRDAGEALDDGEPIHLPLVPRADTPQALYFRVPNNEQLLSYWSLVEGRLRNIRASLTITGAVASLALEAAPIDPQALADAAALGLSVADAIAMATAEPPPHRFRVVHAKAIEYCNEVKALGGALLSTLEKRDGEHLAAIRSQFEKPVLDATRNVKLWQRKQTEKEVEALRKSRDVVDARKSFYSSRENMSDLEKAAFGLSTAAGILDAVGATMQFTSGGLRLIPNFMIGVQGFGGTPAANAETGGESIGESISKFAQGMSRLAGLADRAASLVSTQAGYARRKEDWDHQAAQAALELVHLDQQIAAAALRLAVVDAELRGQDAQDSAWAQIDRLLREKYTNAELYEWYFQRLLDVYRRAYGQAFQLASLARECHLFETGDDAAEQPDPAAWDRDHNGLLAGEVLAHYLRELEVRHLTRPVPGAVVTQHVSLAQVAPAALVALVATGTTGDFHLPAWWFKRLYPGLSNRRIRSVSVSIPCVTGAYVNVNATLAYRGADRTLRRSIALSTGQNDFGFDVSTRAERYLPFERVRLDADSPWRLDFPAGGTDVRLSTIADVIMHVEYEADEGADGATVPAQHQAFLDLARSAPDAWWDLVGPDRPHTCTLDVGPYLPSFLQGFQVTGVAAHALLDTAGAVRTGLLTLAVQAPAEPGAPPLVKVAAVAGTAVPWEELRHLLVVLEVARAH